ncbi:MAG: AraC family transcriptional regulator ligand-binding domain-containing protein [Pseudomonadota bacterium]
MATSASINDSAADAVDQYRLAAAHGRGLAAFCADRGLDLDPIARSVGLDPQVFETLEATVSLDRFARMLEALAALSRDEAFGLKFAERFQLGGTGPFGYAMRSAAGLREQMGFMVRHIGANIDLAAASLEIDGDAARLRWAFPTLLLDTRQLGDFCLILIMRQIRGIMGPNWLAQSAKLTRPRDGAAPMLRRAVCGRIAFGASENLLVVNARDLATRNPDADPILFQMMRDRCEALSSARRGAQDLVMQVRDIALALFEFGPVTADSVAPKLGLSVRSLHRRLAAEGVTFQTVLDETRHALSTRLLTGTDLPLQEISRRVGFAAQSSYTRSAMRWYGRPPSAVRAEARSP